jgi:hypothetical protein
MAAVAALSTSPDSRAQSQPPAGGSPAAIRAVNDEQAAREVKQQAIRERMAEDELRRRDTASWRKLNAAVEKDKAALERPQRLLARLFALPGTPGLSADNKALAEAVIAGARQRALSAWSEWKNQAVDRVAATGRTKTSGTDAVVAQLSARVLNEAALWFGDVEPHASDAFWIGALQSTDLCRRVVAIEPAAQIAVLIEALPADQRAAAWAGETERLSRWGQPSRNLLGPAERTLDDSLGAALQPPTRGATLSRMPDALRDAVQAPGWQLAKEPPAMRCELLRWWSQERVRSKQLTPLQALRAWRTALAARSPDFLESDVSSSGPDATDANGYPLSALRTGLAGLVVIEQDVDAAGRPVRTFVQRRELTAATLGALPALAFEHELDAASLARVAATPVTAPDAAQLRDGFATRRIAIEWVLP